MKRFLKGISVIEILIVVTLFGILLAVSLPFTIKFYQTYQLHTLSERMLNMARSAQEKARSGTGSHGLHIEATFVTLYRGVSYAERNVLYDEVEFIPPSISVTGLTGLRFISPYGNPAVSGNIVLENLGRTDTISVNSQGLIEKL